MDPTDAKAVFLRHLESGPEDDTLLSGLRPYRGVRERHLAEVLHALLVVAPSLNASTEVDRGVVHAIWELCRTVRAWTQGPHEPMFHGRLFIPNTETSRIDCWTDQVESITLALLARHSISSAFLGLPWYIVEWGLGPHCGFLAPLFTAMLQELGADEALDDDKINLCHALGAIGPAAQGAAPVIRAEANQSANSELKAAAAEALRAINPRE